MDLFSPNTCYAPSAGAQMERLIVDLGQMYRERNEALQEVGRAHHDALMRLALAAEYRDNETGVHMVRLGYMAEALAVALGEPAEWSGMLRLAAPLHDIGKIGIPDHVLKKPGRFTPEERAIMNGHAAIGAQILGQSRIPLFCLAAEVAGSHHERWDGTGYPRGLRGNDIPLSGRIVSVVDFFDALTMDRCYRPALPDEEALGMLRDERGGAFEPRLVDTFIANAARIIAVRDRINAQPPNLSALMGHAAPEASLTEEMP